LHLALRFLKVKIFLLLNPLFMKYLCLLFSLSLLTSTGFGQSCSDLFISEIVFGSSNSSFSQGTSENAFFPNYALELFNPTTDSIDLNSYKLRFFTADSSETELDLSGVILPESAYVLSNPLSDSLIKIKANLLDSILAFKGYVMLELTKEGSGVLDVIGKLGLQDEVGQVTLDSLLADPSYLEEINIDLRSVEDLTVRRRPRVQIGNNTFETGNLLDEWRVFPNNFIDHLTIHTSACQIATINWKNIDPFDPEIETEEQEEESINPTITIDGSPSFNSGVDIEPIGAGFVDFALLASPTFDFTWSGIYYSVNIPEGTTGDIEIEEITKIIDDSDVECDDEGFGLLLSVPTGDVFLGVDDLYDILIVDDDCAVSTRDAFELGEAILIYPTVVKDQITILTEQSDLQIEGIWLVNTSGQQVVLSPPSEEFAQRSFDLTFLKSKGYYSVFIKTNQGHIVKKIIKQ
jgi:hypothetical protein